MCELHRGRPRCSADRAAPRGLLRVHEHPKNRGEVINIVMELLKVSEEAARQIFAPYTQADKNVLSKKGELSLRAFNRVLALMSEAGVIPTPAPAAERFIDLRYLQAAGIQ